MSGYSCHTVLLLRFNNGATQGQFPAVIRLCGEKKEGDFAK